MEADRSSRLIAAYTGVSGGTRTTIEYVKRQAERRTG